MLERAAERPLIGWGFATPWVPWDPAFDGWIIDHGVTVMQAHNMWVDVFLQLGVIGLVLMGLIYLATTWRSWFFAVDRPRWDLREDRPYSPLTLLPTLTMAILLVQGLAESSPAARLGLAAARASSRSRSSSRRTSARVRRSRALAIERGELTKQVP